MTRARGFDPAPGGPPCIRPAYTHAQRKALHALAESNPTPERYRAEKERILEHVSG